ncbi:hypothetical protein BZG36_00683 [Bifiguratus adelaidae]|uniref:Protein YIP n=1 Tax=Bifiguratus adelaidae TaxID=1938954 RepID=A0A261Y6S8_9FUNG|nr:hypothetical protein BZG36_00683 [Bifiguratus adelaidae]
MSVLFDSTRQNYYAPSAENLQFYQSSYGEPQAYSSGSYYASDANMGQYMGESYNGPPPGGFWAAFGTRGYPDEPPLLEELGINFSHIKAKSLAVLNPIRKPDQHIMDDVDLAGPLLFCFLFGIFLLFSGKVHFGYIYGVALMGVVSIYTILNMMMAPLHGTIGVILSVLAIAWCTMSSSGMFVSVLHMSEQRFLVAYPVGLFYASFALMTVF